MSKVKLSIEVGKAFDLVKNELGEEMLASFELLLSHYKKSQKYSGDLQMAINIVVNFVRSSFENRFKYFNALTNGYEYDSFQVGNWVVNKKSEVLQVSEINSTYLFDHYFEDKDKDKGCTPHLISECRLATNSEIEMEKQKRFWSKINRRVEEYKVDDIVLFNGMVGTIVAVDKKSVSIKESMYLHKINDIKMICPVENRLDKF